MELVPEISNIDMEAVCAGGSDVAHIDIIMVDNDIQVLAAGHTKRGRGKVWS